jgi:hypothetical protein
MSRKCLQALQLAGQLIEGLVDLDRYTDGPSRDKMARRLDAKAEELAAVVGEVGPPRGDTHPEPLVGVVLHERWDWTRCRGIEALACGAPRVVSDLWPQHGSEGVSLDSSAPTTARLLATVLVETVGGEEACEMIARALLCAWGG